MNHLDLTSLLNPSEHSGSARKVQVLTEGGEVWDIMDVEFDPEAATLYLKCEPEE